jgi:hypothetical protein
MVGSVQRFFHAYSKATVYAIQPVILSPGVQSWIFARRASMGGWPVPGFHGYTSKDTCQKETGHEA